MTTKKRRKINIRKVEQKTINEIVDCEKAYRRHKAFSKAHGKTPQTKEDFIADYLKHQQPKIEAIKNLINKFNDKKAPIMSRACLEFRRLWALRQNCINTELFSSRLTILEWNSFYFHLPSCNSCTAYTMLHKHDSPIATEFKEVTQSEFEKGLDEFFSAIKPQVDSFEEMEQRENLKEIPVELMKHLSSEYSKTQKDED